MIRVGNASGATFDDTFMGYKVSEQTRLHQITAEIFVRDGLDGAINIDRESFNFAHPHYQYILKWLHSSIRQLTNRHKELGKALRIHRLASEGKRTREALAEKVEELLHEHGVEDVPEIMLLEIADQQKAPALRRDGVIAYSKEAILPQTKAMRTTGAEAARRALLEKKAIAIGQILSGWGVLDGLSFDDQEHLLHDIVEIALFGGGT